MKCPKCGSETHRFDNVMYACDKCDWVRHADEVINTLWARAEKAEAELKAIKERIEAINFETLNKIYCNQAFVGTDENCEQIWDYANISIDKVLNEMLDLIKQIGGVKMEALLLILIPVVIGFL